ncbi:MAG: DUF692 domain-containing protein [Hyphomicrobiales bacterium]
MKRSSLSAVKSAGLGFRMPHFADIMKRRDEVPWIELLLDNWLCEDGIVADRLERLINTFPITFHGVGLSIASSSPVDEDYLQQVKNLLDKSDALVYSEHLSFSRTGSQFIPDLLPFPFTSKTLEHVANKIDFVQSFLNRQMLIENVSAYIDFPNNDFSEEDFITDLVKRTGCGLLLDVNNMYVNQVNLGRDAEKALKHLPLDAVQEVHLGGHEAGEGFLIDAHNNKVCPEVWDIYQRTINLTGPVASLIEWDNDIPSFDVLLGEQQTAQKILDRAQPDHSLVSEINYG